MFSFKLEYISPFSVSTISGVTNMHDAVVIDTIVFDKDRIDI